MSKKQHNKQVSRARNKRRTDKFERRSARNRIIIIAMAVLMTLSLFAIPLTQWLASRGDAAAPEPQEPAAQETETPEPVGADDLAIDPNATYLATFATSEGDITVELDAAGAPITTSNLVELAQDGFYDGVIFHRVIDGFMIQAGDPTGTGTGGPGYTIEDELEPAVELVEAAGNYPRGTLAMANTGQPDSGGSQFFIVHQDYPLPPQYAVFGEVVEGMEVVDTIATTPTEQGDRPVDPVEISTVTIDER